MSSLDVLHHDNHQLVVNKPKGILTQPSGTDQINLEDLAKNWIKEHYNKPGNVFLHAVHRIDKPVSGVVLFARTSKALSRLQEAMRDKRCRKTYHAYVEGVLREKEGVLEHYLLHGDHQTEVVGPEVKDAKRAILKFQMKEQFKDYAWVEIELETGRYHQIRAQFAAIGHPILGDLKYGSKRGFAPDGIALHHYQLQVFHPVTGELQTFTAPENT